MAESESLEQKAERLYQFIYQYLKENAQAPSHREMAEHMGCSTETVAKLLNHLEASGRGLQRVRGAHRRMWVPISEMPEEER